MGGVCAIIIFIECIFFDLYKIFFTIIVCLISFDKDIKQSHRNKFDFRKAGERGKHHGNFDGVCYVIRQQRVS